MISALDYWSAQHMPTLTYEQSKALTPPGVHQRFGDARPTYIVDAKEQKIPVALDPFTHAATYSKYKSGTTGKINIVGHAAGITTHISDVRAGRIGDDDLTNASGFLSQIPRECRILADKGYRDLFAQAATYDHEVLIPNRRKSGQVQLEAEQVEHGSEISKPRTVIERLIGNTVDRWPHVERQTVGRLDLMSSVFRVAFFLTRLFPPLVDSTHGGQELAMTAAGAKRRRQQRAPVIGKEASSDEYDSDDPAAFLVSEYNVDETG